MKADGWIYEDNWQAFLTALSWFARYELHPAEIEAIEQGLKDTNTEKSRWYEYTLAGRHQVSFRSGKDDPGTGVVMLEIEAPDDMAQKAQAAIQGK